MNKQTKTRIILRLMTLAFYLFLVISGVLVIVERIPLPFNERQVQGLLLMGFGLLFHMKITKILNERMEEEEKEEQPHFVQGD